MYRKSSSAIAAIVLLVTSCGGHKKPIVVGSKSGTAQVVLGEIVAQHLEHRLGRKVDRNLSLGTTPLAYQALMNGEIGIYPEETGTAQVAILKESPDSDSASTLLRVRNEMKRVSQVTVLDPLGIDNSWTVVVPKDLKIETLSQAAQSQKGWKVGITPDFDQRSDGASTLNQYRLPMDAAPQVGDPASLYAALAAGKLTMVVGNATDGALARHSDWTILRDDQKIFPAYQICLMARSDVLLGDPKIELALKELSGKISTEILRKLAAEVDVDHKKPADVAAEYLAQAGLK